MTRQEDLSQGGSGWQEGCAQLEEEQLQEITGGCWACDANHRLLYKNQRLAEKYKWLAEGAAAKGNRGLIEVYAKKAQFYTEKLKGEERANQVNRDFLHPEGYTPRPWRSRPWDQI